MELSAKDRLPRSCRDGGYFDPAFLHQQLHHIPIRCFLLWVAIGSQVCSGADAAVVDVNVVSHFVMLYTILRAFHGGMGRAVEPAASPARPGNRRSLTCQGICSDAGRSSPSVSCQILLCLFKSILCHLGASLAFQRLVSFGHLRSTAFHRMSNRQSGSRHA